VADPRVRRLPAVAEGGVVPQLQPAEVQAVCLNEVLFGDRTGAPKVEALALHVSSAAEACAGVAGSGGGGTGLLAVAAQGPGVAIFRWGVEASPEIEALRRASAERAASEERHRRREAVELKLQRLRLRLQETDRLEARLQEGGPEALTEEELAKLQRRPEAEAQVMRLSAELGLHQQQEGSDTDDDEDGEEKAEGLGAAARGRSGDGGPSEKSQQEKQERRRAKERQVKEWGKNKQALQKERSKNRDRKFIG